MIGSLITGVINYLFTIVMARLLSPESFGSVASLLSWIAILGFPASVISMHMARQTAIFLTSHERQRLQELSRKINFVSFLGIIILSVILVTVHYTGFFPEDWTFNYVLLISIIIGFSLLTAVNSGLLHGSQYFFRLSLLALIAALLKFFLAGILVANGYDVYGVVVALAASSAISYIFSLWLTRRLFWSSPAQAASEALIKTPGGSSQYLPYIFTALFLLLLLQNIDIILAKHWLDAAAGYYAVLSTAGKVIVFGTAAISGVVFPSAAQTAASGSGQEKRILKISMSTIMLIVIGTVGLYLIIPEKIITTIFGSDYLPAASHLGHIGIIASLWAIIQLYVRLLLAKGNRAFLIPLFLLIAAEVAGISIWHQSIASILLVLFITGAALTLSLAFIYQRTIFTKPQPVLPPNNLAI